MATRRALIDQLARAVQRRGQFSLIEAMLPRGVVSKVLTRFTSGFQGARRRAGGKARKV